MNKIIVATDYSEEADNALQYAAAVAAERGYELLLFSLQNMSIHVLNARLPSSAVNVHLHSQQYQLSHLAQKTKEQFGIEVTPYFASGIFFEELEKCIAVTSAGMLVMGMAPKSLEQDMLGNTTTSAIHRLKIPVLAVPLEASYNGIKHIVFACDIARGVHKRVLDEVHDLAAAFGARVEILNVTHPVKELENTDRTGINDSMEGVPFHYTDVASANVVAAIRQEVVDQKADLLIMVPYTYGFWASLLHKSKTTLMASGSEVPLLSIHL